MAGAGTLGKELELPKGAELNCGLSEDSDSILLKEPLIVIVIGQVREGGLPVLVPKLDRVLYYHQPERPGNVFSHN